jgi:hypothetical protein
MLFEPIDKNRGIHLFVKSGIWAQHHAIPALPHPRSPWRIAVSLPALTSVVQQKEQGELGWTKIQAQCDGCGDTLPSVLSTRTCLSSGNVLSRQLSASSPESTCLSCGKPPPPRLCPSHVVHIQWLIEAGVEKPVVWPSAGQLRWASNSCVLFPSQVLNLRTPPNEYLNLSSWGTQLATKEFKFKLSDLWASDLGSSDLISSLAKGK